jgi:hypothetical protein
VSSSVPKPKVASSSLVVRFEEGLQMPSCIVAERLKPPTGHVLLSSAISLT